MVNDLVALRRALIKLRQHPGRIGPDADGRPVFDVVLRSGDRLRRPASCRATLRETGLHLDVETDWLQFEQQPVSVAAALDWLSRWL